jgi:hypothetical protein
MGSGTNLLEIFSACLGYSEPKAVASLPPLPAGVTVLRHLQDAARTELHYAGRRVIGRQLTAQRTKRRRYPRVLPWTPGWDVAACGGNGGPGKSAASWSGGPPREEWEADRLVSASRLVL